MKRTIATTAALLALGLVACGSDEDPAETGQAPTTTEAPAAEVTPTVACVDDQRQVAYFAYTNSGEQVVEIPVGEANSVTLPDGTTATEQQPATFAPGEQGPAFWVPFEDPAEPPTWSLTGEDGTPREATPDESSPTCEFGPELDPPDDREVTVTATVDDSGDVPVITFTAEGVADGESRCPAGDGWTPETPAVTIVAEGNVTPVDGTDGSTQYEVDFPDTPPDPGFDVAGFTPTFVYVDVVDRCTDGTGATVESWAMGPALRDASQVAAKLCFGVTDEGYDEVDCGEGPGFGTTGGLRNR